MRRQTQKQAKLFDEWLLKANENVDEWGVQHPLEVLAAITEEIGEVNQAYLEASVGETPTRDVYDEIDDLAPLLLQLRWSLEEHSGTFERLPTLHNDDEETQQ